MALRGLAHRAIAKATSRRISAVVLTFIFALGTTSYYLLIFRPNAQRRARIQALVDSGLSVDGSAKFDRRFSDQSYRWPWQENQPYLGDEIEFAEMWLNNSIVTELLLDYYYCNSSSYYCLIWLLGRLQKGVSFWKNAVASAVHGDFNNDGISNYDSLLGPDADVLETFGPNPVTTYALGHNLPKETIRTLKPLETDGQMDQWEEDLIDLVAKQAVSQNRLEWIVDNVDPNPATIYALGLQLPNDSVKLVEPLGKDNRLAEWERYIIDRLEELPSVYVNWAIEKAEGNRVLTDWERYLVTLLDKIPDCFIEQVLDDGQASYEEWMQTQFLDGFSTEYLEEMDKEWICNPDLDGDGFTNEFETRVSSTDPYVCNDRYGVLVYGEDLPMLWRDQIQAVEEFLAAESNSSDKSMWTLARRPYSGLEDRNVYRLFGENMTFQTFEHVIGDLAGRLDSEDMVLLVFAAHGQRSHITFRDGDISYGEINEGLAELKARVVCCIVDACYSGSAISYLESEDRIVMTSSSKVEKTYGGMLHYSLLRAMQNKTNDEDGNGYCSILESFHGAGTLIEDKFGNHPQLSNEELSEATYLAELYLGDR